jgi:hypothetical protein
MQLLRETISSNNIDGTRNRMHNPTITERQTYTRCCGHLQRDPLKTVSDKRTNETMHLLGRGVVVYAEECFRWEEQNVIWGGGERNDLVRGESNHFV